MVLRFHREIVAGYVPTPVSPEDPGSHYDVYDEVAINQSAVSVLPPHVIPGGVVLITLRPLQEPLFEEEFDSF